MEDRNLYEKTKALQDLPCDVFEVKEKYCPDKLLQLFLSGNFILLLEINELDEKIAPWEKLEIFTRTHKIVSDYLSINCKGAEGPGADEINPMMIYLLVKSLQKRLYTNIK